MLIAAINYCNNVLQLDVAAGDVTDNTQSASDVITIMTSRRCSESQTHTHTQTHRQACRHTSSENIISAIHYVHLAEINKQKLFNVNI